MHFAQVSGDFGVVFGVVSALQYGQGGLFVAHAEFNPAQAVGDHRVFRREFKRFDDQRTGFGQTHIAIGQGITQGVVSVLEFRIGCNDAAQQFFHLVDTVDFFGRHGHFIAQVQIFRLGFAGFGQDLISSFVHFVVAQQLQFSLQADAFFLGRVLRQIGQQGACLGHLAATGQHVGALNLHLSQGFGIVNLVQPAFSFSRFFLVVGDFRQHQISL